MGSMNYESRPYLNLIAAYSLPGRVLGDSTNPHGMPWGNGLKADLRHFADLTGANTLIVGANTLPFVERLHGSNGRNVIVVGHDIKTPCIVEPTLQDAVMRVHCDPATYGEPFVAGGARTYYDALWLIRNEPSRKVGVRALFFATEIHADFKGDVLMPELGDGWVEVRREHPDLSGEPTSPPYDFVTYQFV